MSTIAEMRYVMQSFEDGMEIEARQKIGQDRQWMKAPNPMWNWEEREYRVKPREVWMNIYQSTISMMIYNTPEEADANAGKDRIRRVRLVEVSDD